MFDQATLPCGLRVIGEKMDHVRSCSVGCFTGVGSRNETEQENGLSHFIEHMVFKGTQHRTARQIADEMDRVGGHLNAYTSKECTCFYAKVTDDQLPLAVDMISDLVQHPLFDPQELKKEKGVVLEEIAMSEDTPEEVIMDTLDEVQYDGSLKYPVLGSKEKISAYTRKDLHTYWERHYYAGNMVLAISGHYDWEAFLELADRYFNHLPNREAMGTFGREQRYLSRRGGKDKDIEQLHVVLAFPGVASSSDDYYALSILSGLFGEGMSSRLFQRIREEMGKVYSISSFPASFKDIGTFNIYTAMNPESGEEVIREIWNQVGLLLRDGITEDEFNRAKTQLRVEYLFSLESSGNRMQSIGRSLLTDGRVKSPQEIVAKIQAVTQEQVLELARRLMSAPCSGAVLGRDTQRFLPFLQSR